MFARTLAPLMLATILPVSAASAQEPPAMHGMEHAHHHDDAMVLSQEQLGSVHFPVSCAAGIQKEMERGVALLHSFGYVEAERQFRHAAEQDTQCAMAHWGIAMTQYKEIWGRPDEEAQTTGAEEMRKAEALARVKPVTPREQGYIDALNTFFVEDPPDFQRAADDYAAAMRHVHDVNPGDVEAAAFYALAELGSEHPDDTSLTHERTALSVLLPLFKANPQHPGLAHYIIHTCDTPQLAAQGLEAAKVYAQIAPSSAHALHMPGHIFARLGLWQDDIASNLASQKASFKAEATHEPGAAHQMHADEFLIYAYLQVGQDAKAKALMDSFDIVCTRMDSMPGMDDMKGSGTYRANTMHAIYALEMRDWKGAEKLQPLAGSSPFAGLITQWANGIGAAHSFNNAVAEKNLASVDAFITETKKGPQAYRVEGMEVYRNELAGWTAFSEKKNDEALRWLQQAAEKQDKLGQNEVDIPAREMLGDMLLLLRRPDEALTAYKTALTLSPNRLNGLLGAGQAAEQTGDRASATQFYTIALTNTAQATASHRPELEHALAYVKAANLSPSSAGF